ncbi:hypothetical protein C8Q70DRAFT_1049738 [Cubamyces menziesii]|nr:hypothetical protein C8Q70DRAFT_1049738 [Cubamyces menziesii]
MHPTLLENDPLRVFAIACCFGLEAEAKAAAEKAVINNRVSGRTCPELGKITAGAYYRLLQLNRTRRSTKLKAFGNVVAVDSAGIGPFCEPPQRTAISTRTPLRSAVTPFDAEDADLVLRSRDSVDFRVYRSILVVASPTILQKAPLLEVADTEGDKAAASSSAIHLIPVDSVVLNALLRMCYPVDHPQLSDLDLLLDVLFAARNYGMKNAEQAIRETWHAHIDKAPLRLYLAAACCDWADEARACANALVQQHDLPSIYSQYLPEMETMTNRAYHRLIFFLEARSKAATSPHILTLGDEYPSRACNSAFSIADCSIRYPRSFNTSEPPLWCSSCFTSFTAAFRDRPLASTLALTTEHVKSFMRTAASSNCTAISQAKCNAADHVSWACAVLECYAREVETAVGKVELEVDGLAT